jgi:hypothetical protein
MLNAVDDASCGQAADTEDVCRPSLCEDPGPRTRLAA